MSYGFELYVAIALLITVAILGFMDNRLRNKSTTFITLLCSTPIVANILQNLFGIHSAIIFLTVTIIYIVATKKAETTTT